MRTEVGRDATPVIDHMQMQRYLVRKAVAIKRIWEHILTTIDDDLEKDGRRKDSDAIVGRIIHDFSKLSVPSAQSRRP